MAPPETRSIFESRTHLIAMVTVADAGTVVKAAEILEKNQPAVSRIIVDLEKKLGATLFERARRGMRPTILGAVAIERARVILREIEDAESTLEQVRTALDKMEPNV